MNKRIFITLGVIIFLILFITFLRYRTSYYDVMFQDPIDARELVKIDNSKFKLSSPFKGLSFSTSFWIFIKDWNYKYMSEKVIFNKGGFKCLLTGRNNDLVVEIPVFASRTPESITFKNVPLQKWLNIAIIVDNRFLDLWINGELYYSKHLSNLPLIQEKKPLLICNNRGFDGYVSSFYYWNRPISKIVLLRIFDDGPINNGIISKLIRLWNRIRKSVNINVDVNVDVDDDKDETSNKCEK